MRLFRAASCTVQQRIYVELHLHVAGPSTTRWQSQEPSKHAVLSLTRRDSTAQLALAELSGH